MRNDTADLPAQVQALLDALGGDWGEALLAVYLHGSAVSGGLRPQSDVDLIVVIDRPMSEALRRGLLDTLLKISAPHPSCPGGPRCLEVIVFHEAALAAPGYPATAEFVYGEWRRETLAAAAVPRPVTDPELTLVLAQARRQARPLLGPAATALLPEIPVDHIHRAMRDALPALLDGLRGDGRNVLLTLARMWRTAATGEFVTKDVAAAWAADRLPNQAAEVLGQARAAYLGGAGEEPDARQTAECLRRRVEEFLRPPSGRRGLGPGPTPPASAAPRTPRGRG